MKVQFCAVATLVVLWVGARTASPAEVPETLDPSAPCVTSECHSEIGELANFHWEDIQEECRECHEGAEEEHDFSVEAPPALCMNCHDPVDTGATLHDPAEEDCLECHNPHGSKVGWLLAAESQPEICFGCHDEEDVIKDEYKHGPVESGECSGCHNPHSSDHASLLRAEGNDLCLGCHEDIAEAMEAAEFVHGPAEDDCRECHGVHTGPYPKMLPAEGRAVCDECHDDIVAIAEEAEVDHAPTRTGDECLNCHAAHAGDGDPNLKKPQLELCLDCHDEPVESGDSMLTDMKTFLERNDEWHQPIRDKSCAGCHDPHGSQNVRLLKQSFPPGFYTSFDVDSYGLCFSCHDEPMVTVKSTRTLTGFRNGNQNLHYLHVNRKKRGRTCRACHDMHASKRPLHIRERVPYGKWQLPINFKKRETGGSCRPGCHSKESYDREGE
jgi:predicted CXXCH cytochrome family protein